MIKDGKHFLPEHLLQRTVNVVVVGAGGSGSHVVCDLAVLHQSMLDLGHPNGLDVTVLDFDTVSAANVGRARFYAADCGLNKAQVLVNRINMCYGLQFKASSERITPKSSLLAGADIVIGCVDTRESRRAIWSAHRRQNSYYLDLGNGSDDGQVILGQMPAEVRSYSGTKEDAHQRLPTVIDLYPEMLVRANDPTDSGPSCSRAEALRKQSAFVNKTAALHAVSMLSCLFRDGWIDHHAVFFNVKKNRSSTLACDPAAWQRFGYEAKAA